MCIPHLICTENYWVRSRYGTGVSFDKMFVFCDKFCIRSDKYVSIVVKIKCVNSDNISDICNKLNFTTNYIHFTTTNTYFIRTHIKSIIFNTFNGTIPPRHVIISAINNLYAFGNFKSPFNYFRY